MFYEMPRSWVQLFRNDSTRPSERSDLRVLESHHQAGVVPHELESELGCRLCAPPLCPAAVQP
jgi:hypothetical protein